MSEEVARKICEQMTGNIDDFCHCCREGEKGKSCIGCRETAIETILKENAKLKEDINFCLPSIKQEMEMSNDGRTRKEMKTCYDILKGGDE